MPEFLWQNDGRGHYRTGQRAAARFINSRDANDTEGAQFFFVTKTAALVHRRQITRFSESGKLRSVNRDVLAQNGPIVSRGSMLTEVVGPIDYSRKHAADRLIVLVQFFESLLREIFVI